MAKKLPEIEQNWIDLVIENKDKDDDDIKSLLIGEGVRYGDVNAVLDFILVDQGLRLTKEQIEEKADDLMADFTINEDTTANDVSDQVDLLMEELMVNARKARGYVRRAFEDAEIAMPKAAASGKPRGPRQPGFGGDAKIATDWLIANPSGDYETFQSHMEELGRATTVKGKDKTKDWFNFLGDIKVFVEAWKAAGNCE